MDVVVYVLLFSQILSGILVAFTARWGSGWFASVLTPYLISIFAFNPEIGAVSAMPWLIQFHIASAFFMIGIMPFSRFMHIFVAPIDYLWRNYQLVIWNQDKKQIRNPGMGTRSKHAPKNN